MSVSGETKACAGLGAGFEGGWVALHQVSPKCTRDLCTNLKNRSFDLECQTESPRKHWTYAGSHVSLLLVSACGAEGHAFKSRRARHPFKGFRQEPLSCFRRVYLTAVGWDGRTFPGIRRSRAATRVLFGESQSKKNSPRKARQTHDVALQCDLVCSGYVPASSSGEVGSLSVNCSLALHPVRTIGAMACAVCPCNARPTTRHWPYVAGRLQ